MADGKERRWGRVVWWDDDYCGLREARVWLFNHSVLEVEAGASPNLYWG